MLFIILGCLATAVVLGGIGLCFLALSASGGAEGNSYPQWFGDVAGLCLVVAVIACVGAIGSIIIWAVGRLL